MGRLSIPISDHRAIRRDTGGQFGVRAAGRKAAVTIKTVAEQLMRSPRFRRTALIVGGAAAVGTIGAVAARYRFYQTIVAQEVEKALKPVHAQLDDLQATVDAMAEAEGIEPEKTRKGKKYRR